MCQIWKWDKLWFTMSILHSSARPSGASRRSSEALLREALLSARRGPVVHRATRTNLIDNSTFRFVILAFCCWLPPKEIKLSAPRSCHGPLIVDLLIKLVAGEKFSQNCKLSVLEISSSKTGNGTEIGTKWFYFYNFIRDFSQFYLGFIPILHLVSYNHEILINYGWLRNLICERPCLMLIT